MKLTAIMMLLTTLGTLGWEGRFATTYEAAASGDVGKAITEFGQSMQQALRDHDPEYGNRPQIR